MIFYLDCNLISPYCAARPSRASNFKRRTPLYNDLTNVITSPAETPASCAPHRSRKRISSYRRQPAGFIHSGDNGAAPSVPLTCPNRVSQWCSRETRFCQLVADVGLGRVAGKAHTTSKLWRIGRQNTAGVVAGRQGCRLGRIVGPLLRSQGLFNCTTPKGNTQAAPGRCLNVHRLNPVRV